MSSLRKLAPPGTGGTIESEQGNMLVAFSGPIRIRDSSRAESISIRGVEKYFEFFLWTMGGESQFSQWLNEFHLHRQDKDQ